MKCNYLCTWNVKVLRLQRTKRRTHDVRNIKTVADTITRRGVGTDANIISKTCTMVSITDSNRTWNLYGTVRKLAYCTILSRTGCLRIQRCQQRTPRFWFRRFLTRGFPRDFGGLAQLGERLLCTQEVSGSNPLFSIGRTTHQHYLFDTSLTHWFDGLLTTIVRYLFDTSETYWFDGTVRLILPTIIAVDPFEPMCMQHQPNIQDSRALRLHWPAGRKLW